MTAGSTRLLAGRVLAVGSTAPAAAVLAALAVWEPLLVAGRLTPLAALLTGVPAALLAAVPVGLGAARRAVAAPPVAVAALLLLTVAFGVLAAGWDSQNVVLRRDPGSYALLSSWVADHGSRDVPVQWDRFGGRDPALSAASPAYYPGGDSLVPQFLSGAPMAFAAGRWIGGTSALLATPAVLGALGLLAFAGLAWRLVGAWPAVLATALLGTAYPVLHVARSTYSEPLALLALAAGLALLLDADESAVRRDSAWLALAAGGVLGVATLARIEALREVALLLPVAVAVGLRSRLRGGALAVGLALGTGLGLLDGYAEAYPYLDEIRDSVRPLVALLVALAVAGVALVALDAHRPLPRLRVLRRGSPLGPLLVLLVAAGLAVRPWVSPGRQDPASGGGRAVRAMQAVEHLPLDGSRTYTEQVPHWVAWWVGWPAVVLAVLGALLLVRRAPAVVLVLGGSAVLVALRVGITPDHPWADRRLVPSALPVVALCSAAVVGRVAGRSWWRRVVAAAGVLALLVPAAHATWPLLGKRTEVGEPEAVAQACAALRPGDVAFLLDLRARREWSQPLRGTCGVPSVGVLDRTRLPELMAAARRAGSTPVLVAATYPDRVGAAGLDPVHVVHLVTSEDARVLSSRPSGTVRLYVDLWLGR
ncbi:hypothetical protein EV189_1971 [Motilibacter rhizosphaerae]|uniref:Dolichyl-phosphate-mannose-protein mannosyltransferase n=1 Tax=Motilibacter rhizosphaerae TaxID=598652 RepID=A0A4Q7NSV0_9ACTN|nr:hypothetical protein [Motilibacter rhizosphaerae]RZS90187.1 hypothetical protein EV189_1971 [Motilibacter rhizosphaerae]